MRNGLTLLLLMLAHLSVCLSQPFTLALTASSVPYGMAETEAVQAEFYALPLASYRVFRQEAEAHASFDLHIGEDAQTLFRRPRPSARVTLLTAQGPTAMPLRKANQWFSKDDTVQGQWTLGEFSLTGAFLRNGETWMMQTMESVHPDTLYFRLSPAHRDEPLPGGCHARSIPDLPTLLPLDNEAALATGGERHQGCKIIEYAAAADWTFVEMHGSAALAMDRIEAVISLVEWQYSQDFQVTYTIEVVDYYLSACPTCDPAEWGVTQDAGALLGGFQTWAMQGGFALGYYDLASLWTGRVLLQQVLGAAYIQGVCNTQYRYQVLRDFSSDPALMRAMVSHEFGHSLSAVHDAGDGFIMSTPLNNTTVWSAPSIQNINTFTQSRPCLSNCFQVPPPVAGFSGEPRQGCAPMMVQFTDESLNDPDTWTWQLAGGQPSTATDPHPLVLYPSRGSYAVSLTVQNAGGSSTLQEPLYIEVADIPLVGFDAVNDGLKVFFTNNSSFGEHFLWDFGDGTTSQETHPIHQYAKDGDYLVQLVATNPCGQAATNQLLQVWRMPLADFRADTLWGCDSLQVSFLDTSGEQVESRQWWFPGGSPESSTHPSPVVQYAQPGLYPVRLIVQNPSGRDTLLRSDYILIRPVPDTNFLLYQYGDSIVVAWTGEADSLWWSFEANQGSDQPAAGHRYLSPGTKRITLQLWTPCGLFTGSQEITIYTVPMAMVQAQPTEGCTGTWVRFEDHSPGPVTSRQWSFPGGQPSGSTDSLVWVRYDDPGAFPVGLSVENPAGTDDWWRDSLVQIFLPPTADFQLLQTDWTIVCTSLESQSASHLWTFGDGASATGPEVTHTYLQPDSYTVTHVISNVCAGDTLAQVVLIEPTALVPGEREASAYRVWPNPVRELLEIHRQTAGTVAGQISLLDLRGIVAVTTAMHPGQTAWQLQLQGLPPGTYVLHIRESDRLWSYPIIVLPGRD